MYRLWSSRTRIYRFPFGDAIIVHMYGGTSYIHTHTHTQTQAHYTASLHPAGFARAPRTNKHCGEKPSRSRRDSRAVRVNIQFAEQRLRETQLYCLTSMRTVVAITRLVLCVCVWVCRPHAKVSRIKFTKSSSIFYRMVVQFHIKSVNAGVNLFANSEQCEHYCVLASVLCRLRLLIRVNESPATSCTNSWTASNKVCWIRQWRVCIFKINLHSLNVIFVSIDIHNGSTHSQNILVSYYCLRIKYILYVLCAC